VLASDRLTLCDLMLLLLRILRSCREKHWFYIWQSVCECLPLAAMLTQRQFVCWALTVMILLHNSDLPWMSWIWMYEIVASHKLLLSFCCMSVLLPKVHFLLPIVGCRAVRNS